MQNAFKKFFLSSTSIMVFLIIALLSGLGEVIATFAFNFTLNDIAFALFYLLIPVFLFTLAVSYSNHDKNIMKCTIGVVLALLLSLYLCYIASYGFSILRLISMFLVLAILVTHLVINSEHKNSKNIVFLNQLFTGLLIIAAIVNIFTTGSTNIIYISFAALNSILVISSICVIICIEARLDAYRIKREAAGWTEEKKN